MPDDLMTAAPLPDAPQVDLPAGDLASEVEQPLSIEDEMQETFARIEREEAEAAEAKPAAKAPVRGPDGKFAPAAADDEQAVAAPAPADGEFVDKGPPSSWRAGAKALWDGIAPELKQEIYKREQDVFAGIGQYRAKAEYADSLNQVIQPYQPIIAAVGANVPQALNEVLRTAAVFHVGSQAQKIATLRQLAQTHGIDIGQVAANAAPDPFADPVVSQLQNEVAQLRGAFSNQQRAAQDSAVNSAWGEIVAFSNDTSHRYFGDVREQMGQLMRAGLADTLADAYDKACQLNPSVKAAIAAEQSAAAVRKANNERAQKAATARRAGNLGVRSSPGPRPVSNGQGTMEETMMARYKELTAES
jgi:hypothetical protein